MKLPVFALTITLAAISLTPACAQKTTIDPNTKKAAVKETDPVKLDPRLAKKITYFSTDKRLHTVLEELSKQTGVMISCGKDSKDWKVRDLPVVVCANDLQLGMLLRSIADATHLVIAPSVVKGERRYKIWRSYAREKQLSDYFTQLPIAALERASWEWDALVKMADMPLPDMGAVQGTDDEDQYYPDPKELEMSRTYGKILAALPPGTKEKVFAGEKLTLKLKELTPPLSGYVESLYRDQFSHEQQMMADAQEEDPDIPKETPKDLTNEDIQNIQLDIQLGSISGFGEEGLPSITAKLEPGMLILSPENALFSQISDLKNPLNELEEPRTEYSPNLEQFIAPEEDEEGVVKAPTEKQEKTFTIEKPKDKKFFTIADYISEFAKATGYSIICEDFQSHTSSNMEAENNTTFTSALCTMCNSDLELYTDKNSKLVVGSAYQWYEHHNNMVPESIITNLKNKLNGDGAELDDVTPMWGLTFNAYDEWIASSRDLEALSSGMAIRAELQGEDLWKLYSDLSSTNKALARSEEGLPLSKLNIDSITPLFTKSAKRLEKMSDTIGPMVNIAMAMEADPELEKRVSTWAEKYMREKYPESANGGPGSVDKADMDNLIAAVQEQFPELKQARSIPTDPSVISTLTLHVIKHEVTAIQTIHTTDANGEESVDMKERPEAPKKSVFALAITGEGVNLKISGPGLQFPVYSYERDAEIWKEFDKKKKEK